jgi:hypothetical protein
MGGLVKLEPEKVDKAERSIDRFITERAEAKKRRRTWPATTNIGVSRTAYCGWSIFGQ